MTASRRLPGAALAAVGLLAALVVAYGAVATADHAQGFKEACAIVAAAGLVIVCAAARPAWTISLGLGLSVFNSYWPDMGIPFSVDRLLLAVGGASVLYRVVREHGWARLRTEPIHWLLALVTLYALVSAVLAGTLDDTVARYALVDRFSLMGFALFFLAPHVFAEARDRQILLGTLVVLGAYLGITALLETIGPRSLVVPGYITDPSVGIHIDRARGPFAEAAANGMALFTCGVAAVIAAATWRTPRWRWLAGAVAILCALGVLFTLTRAAWLAAGIGAIAAMLATPQTRRLLGPLAIVGALAVLGAFATIPGLQGKADSRANDQRPVWDRKNSNAAAGRMIDQHPLFGSGWGRFAFDSPSYYRQSPSYPLTSVREVHNVFLSNAVELGLVGALLWGVAVLAAIGGAALKRGPPELKWWKVGLIALLVQWIVVASTNPLAFPMPVLILWTWAGLARGLPEVRRSPARSPLRDADPSPAAAPWAAPAGAPTGTAA